MISRVLFIILLVIGLCGLGAIGWIVLHPAPPPHAVVAKQEQKPAPSVVVLSAKQDIASGTLLTAKMLMARTLSGNKAPEGTLLDTPENRRMLTGALLQHETGENQPFFRRDILSPEERGFLAATLTPGYVAQTINVTGTTGVAGLIWPGDHVDILITLQNHQSNTPLSKQVGGQLLLSDVRVLAVDRHMVHSAQSGPDGSATTHYITLEISPQYEQTLAIAAQTGEISLAVRSVSGVLSHGSSATARPKMYWAGDVLASMEKKSTVRVHAGSESERDYVQ